MKVYWIEVSYLKDDNKNGVVYIFVKAKDAIHAFELADEDLCVKGLKPYKWDFIEPYMISMSGRQKNKLTILDNYMKKLKKLNNVFLINSTY